VSSAASDGYKGQVLLLLTLWSSIAICTLPTASAQPVEVLVTLPSDTNPMPTTFVFEADSFRVITQRTWQNIFFGLCGWEYHTLLAVHRSAIIAKQDSIIASLRTDSVKYERIIAQSKAKEVACTDSLASANAGITLLNRRVDHLLTGRKARNWFIAASVLFNLALATALGIVSK